MPYYHIYVDYIDKKGRERKIFYFNFLEEEVREVFAVPFMKNRAILVYGNFVYPSDINRIEIFKSEKKFQELVLPNGKLAVDERNNAYTELCFSTRKVEGVSLKTFKFITSPPKRKEEKLTELTNLLMDSASFLGLNNNWSLATCTLQLQEVAVTLVAKIKKIKLDKANVEKILKKKMDSLSFNDQYEAFSRQVKDSSDVEMPILTTHLRRMRTKVLHEGYNPKPEETESIASFTIGLLKKLKDIS